MNIQIVCAGKIKDKWLKLGIEDYSKRLNKYVNLEIVEVQDASDNIPELRAKEEESERLLAKVKPNSHVVALDVSGKHMDSLELANHVPKWLEQGGSNLCFIIAGSLGFSDELLLQCNYRLSMSKMTFTHQMARVILLEQIYRAFKINKNEKYHK